MMDKVIEHKAVLVDRVKEIFSDVSGFVIDATVGTGGHSYALLSSNEKISVIGVDRDSEALEVASVKLFPFRDRVVLINDKFSNLPQILERLKIDSVAGILVDLGVSSLQLDDPDRGFSFRFDSFLDMRMGLSGRAAADILESLSVRKLAEIFREFGEERQAYPIARKIVEVRKKKPLKTTFDLRNIVYEVKGRTKEGKIDAATRVFQALRIYVNSELEELKNLLSSALDLLSSGGKITVISYHSLEDRIVKRTFKSWSVGEKNEITGQILPGSVRGKMLTKKPIVPSLVEINENPRSRSAKLRVFRKCI